MWTLACLLVCAQPRIFMALTDMLKCGAKKQGVTYLLHYLDDYIIMGAPGS